jgi:hypothetical protein
VQSNDAKSRIQHPESRFFEHPSHAHVAWVVNFGQDCAGLYPGVGGGAHAPHLICKNFEIYHEIVEFGKQILI